MSDVKKPDEYEEFLKSLAVELHEMADSEILEGDDPSTLRNENLAMVTNAKAGAGRRRLAAGRAGFDASRPIMKPTSEVSLATARAVIQAAMNDQNFTMAARSLSEMTDEDIIRLYHQIQRLKDTPHGNR